jgi:hypothetical protein
MNPRHDLFKRRLAKIEVQKAHRAVILMLVDCIEKMQSTGLTEQEIASIFRRATDAWIKEQNKTDVPAAALRSSLSGPNPLRPHAASII